MKTILNITGFFIYAGVMFAIGYLAGQQTDINEFESPTITEQMKSIQRQVGCVKIDGEIGPETTPLVNAQVRAEKKAAERELFNQYAIEAMERMAGDKK